MAPVLVSKDIHIIDIRRNDLHYSLMEDIHSGLNPHENEVRTLPTILLYDVEGLRIFEDITHLDEYYLTNAEIEVLKTYAKTIAEKMPDNVQLVELGSGNLRKIEILLKEFERSRKNVVYYGLDLSLQELRRTFSEVSAKSYMHVQCYGLHGTYDDALAWLQNPDNRKRPTCVLSMGSSLGNFSRSGAVEFLSEFAALLSPRDSMLIGLDGCKNKDKIRKAYNDSKGISNRFYLNGLSHANAVLGYDAFQPGEWEVITRYNDTQGCHQAFYAPVKDSLINGVRLQKGEMILVEEAFKYDPGERELLWQGAGLSTVLQLGNYTDDYHIHMLAATPIHFPTKPSQYAASWALSQDEWKLLWKAWDIVTKDMVIREELLSKPIKLRNPLVFYLGHIPTFLDMHLTRATRGKPTEPKSYPIIFERGIDPDVENPEQCHSHSEIPNEWPLLDEILAFQDRVRNRVISVMEIDGVEKDCTLSEALWIGFEHEAMHLETFLYMLLQNDKTRAPSGIPTPDFRAISLEAKENEKPNSWFSIPRQTIAIGLPDIDKGSLPEHSFGWDNETPQRVVTVPSFEAQARAITNGEYARFLELNSIGQIPASWISDDSTSRSGLPPGDHANCESYSDATATECFVSKFSVLTVFGPVLLKWALDWPVMASYDELAAYATWMNCRIPTFEEVKSIYNYSAHLQETGCDGFIHVTDKEHSGTATNGDGRQLEGSNGDGYDRTRPRCPDHQPVKHLSITSMLVFIDLDGCNVGFKHWHPIPVTPYGDKLAGQGRLGGVWEWTSTPLMPHDGFKPMELYPAYTADFFDGKHNIALGGSWATHPRIAGRTTFVNWYQHNYPYAWVGARLVRDLDM